MQLKNKIALITGAGSGIGQATAYSLAKRGCHLALADIQADRLEETATQTKLAGINVSTHILDVANRESVSALPAKILEVHGGIDLLINNAGVAAGGKFVNTSEASFDRVMAVNFQGLVHMTRVFLPYLKERDEALIANVSSLFGLISPPEQTAYSASKFAVRGFSNALRFELERTNVRVTVIHPGGVATNIAKDALPPEGVTDEKIRKRKAAQQKLLKMPPEKAGEIIVKGIEADRARILVGTDAKIIALIERLFPVNYLKVMKILMPVK